MRYSLEPKYKKYVQGYGFLSFEENLEINMVKNYWILQQKQEYPLQKLLPKE